MIAAEAKLMTYEEAAARLGLKKQFISRRVATGEIVVTDLGHHCKRISEMDFLTYLERKRATEKRRKQ